MMHEPQPWLPPAAAGEIERQLAMLAGDWAARWLRAARSVTAEPSKLLRHSPAGWRGCPAAAVGVSPEELLMLGQAAVAGRADVDNPRDREILASIGRRAAGDLIAAVCRIASPGIAVEDLPGEPDTGTRQRYRLGAADWSLELSLDDIAQIRLRRHTAGSARQPVLAKLTDALAPEPVELGCHLGKAALSAAAVTALAKGDLIVLDRRTTEPLRLTVEGTTVFRGKASIEAAAGAFSVRITETLDLSPGSD